MYAVTNVTFKGVWGRVGRWVARCHRLLELIKIK